MPSHTDYIFATQALPSDIITICLYCIVLSFSVKLYTSMGISFLEFTTYFLILFIDVPAS
jgi:hypothetical protein